MKHNQLLSNILIIVIFGIAAILTLPWLLVTPTSGLDPSWRIGLNMATINNFQFGKDIVFTFGPLGFLYSPTYTDYKLWTISSSFTLITHFIFLSSIALLAIKSSLTWKQNIFVLITLLSTLPLTYIEYKLLISVAVLLYLVITGQIDRKHIVYIQIISSILLAIASQLKFSSTLASLSIIFIFILYCLHQKQLKWLFYVLFSYVITFLSLWVASGQEFVNLPAYFSYSLDISKGYNSAMMIVKKNPLQILIGILVMASTFFLWLTAAIKRNFNLFLFISIFSGIIIISFKHGFVRQDGHVFIFFANILIFLCLLYISNNSGIDSIRRFLILFLSLILFIAIHDEYPYIMKPNINRAITAMDLPSFLLSNPEKHEEITAAYKDSIRKSSPLSKSSIDYLQNKSVDIFPWEISMAYAYDLNWLPRPVFQSYSVYTSKLDLLNARHFEKSNAPERIIYFHMSIDGRYPLYDEPATFQRLLCTYNFHLKDGGFILLGKKAENNCGDPHPLSSITASIGDTIEVPEHIGGYLFSKIRLDYSFIGKVMGLFYKPSEAYITLTSNISPDGLISNKFKWIQGNADNGIFLSQYVEEVNDYISLFSGEIDINKTIRKIRIDTANKRHFNDEIHIDFFSIPSEISLINKAPDWQELKIVNGGQMVIDSINDLLFSQSEDQIIIDMDKHPSLTLRGWAFDDNMRNSGNSIYLAFKNDNEEIRIPTKRELRPDVAKHFGEDSYMQSGWTSSINSDNFKEMCYGVSVHIIRDNKKEYYKLDGNKKICIKKNG